MDGPAEQSHAAGKDDPGDDAARKGGPGERSHAAPTSGHPRSEPTSSHPLQYPDFEKVDMRVGVVTDAREFPEARRPAYQLWIDFGSLGVKRASAQITRHYQPAELIGRRVIAVVNFPPKQIGPFRSEVLVLGAYDEAGEVILLHPDKPVAPGSKIG